MTPTALAEAVHDALITSVRDGDLHLDESAVPDQVRVERPRDRAHGDWATSVALQLAKSAGMPPRGVAEVLAARLRAVAGVSGVDVAGPGFLNITVDAAAAGELARTVVAAGPAYGRSGADAGLRVNLEYVSANPTGPIHLGGARWAAVGDSLARVLAATGAEVTREYYFNDHGGQIDRFARSLLAAAREQPVPEDGYAGEYITEIAARVVADARYSLVRSSMDSTIDIDVDLLTRRSNDNPVYYVQYAHARACGVSRNAADLGVALQRPDGSDGFDPALLDDPTETALLAALADHPRVVAQAAQLREPHRVARSLEALAGTYHRWYDARRVTPVGEEEVTDTHRTRLWLNRATTTVLAGGLDLLGVSAPERM